ncbi:MAG TPA: Uma2 family endonuclease [Leptolyngbyaceae cyanobacterium]
MTYLTLNLLSTIELTEEQFYQICQTNRHLRIEQGAKGELLLMPERSSQASLRNIKLWNQLYEWEISDFQKIQGTAFADSHHFRLPNGAIRCPDAAWVRVESLRQVYGDLWEYIIDREKENIHYLSPDLVIEFYYPYQNLQYLQWKMQEYIENGSSLGWLIEVEAQQVQIYRKARRVEILQFPETLSGEFVIPGFELNTKKIFVLN